MNRRVCIAMLGVGLGVACALGGPLDKSRVDAKAKWVVHADVEAMVASKTGRFLSEHRAELNLDDLDEFKAKTGLDVFRDVLDVTVYGLQDSPEEAVAIVRGTEKLETAVDALMAEEETAQRVQVGGRAALKWMEDGTARYGYMKTLGAGEGSSRAFFVSKEITNLERALAVVDGGEASLATVREGAMAESPRRGAMVYIVVSDLNGAPQHAPKVLRSAKDVRAEIGEDAEGFYAELRLRAGSADDLRNIADFGRGLLAVGRMATQGDDDLRELAQVLDGVKIDATDVELRASFRIGNELLEGALAEIKSQHAKAEGAAIEKTSSGSEKSLDSKGPEGEKPKR